MEKKNTILLTVIAIATLLVAVVGATFAYFTATVNTTGDTTPTTITTKTLASATMDLGSQVVGENVLPGYKVVKTVTLKGVGEDQNSAAIKTQITLTPSVTAFADHVKYTVYEVATADVATLGISCAAPVTETGTTADGLSHYMSTACTIPADTTVKATGTFTGTTPVIIDNISVDNTTDLTYYVLIEYVNDEDADQNDEQGETFTVDISFKEVA